MKFGDNLDHLSYPRWKCYNLDYNGLKKNIRLLSENRTGFSLARFNKEFEENVENTTVFLKIKRLDIQRKIESCERRTKDIIHDDKLSVTKKQIALDDAFYEMIVLSSVLNELLKFVLVQKIACRKIFKKLLKYYSNVLEARIFVQEKKMNLRSEEDSLFHFNLTDLTLRLTILTNTLKIEHRKLYDYSDSLKKETFSLNTSNSANRELPQNHNFDLEALIKRNFRLDFLILSDVNKLNELSLNLNIYLGFKNCNRSTGPTLMSYIILLEESKLQTSDPSYILSYKNQPFLLLICHSGGLRRFSYCKLPNEIVEILLGYLSGTSETDIWQVVGQYMNDHLTEITLNSIMQKKLKPKLKFLCKRFRFSLVDEADVHSSADDNDHFERDYLVTLDQDIYTTNNPDLVNNLDFNMDGSLLESFPFNKLTLFSNDYNLSKFEESLRTEIHEEKLQNYFDASLLRKFPPMIKKLIRINSANLFKNLSIYDYMLSCYFGKIPSDQNINNHFSNILNLNLFKFLENTQNLDDIRNIESSLIGDKSNKILRHQLSLKSVTVNNSEESEYEYDPSISEDSRPSSTPVYKKWPQDLHSPFSFDPSSLHSDNRPSRGRHLKNKERFTTGSFMDNVVLSLMQTERNEALRSDLETSMYGSLEGYLPSLLYRTENDMSHKATSFQKDFEKGALHVFYLCLFLSLFISGIESGVIFSISYIKLILKKPISPQNLWILIVLITGQFFSLLFNLMSLLLLSRMSGPFRNFFYLVLILDILVALILFIITVSIMVSS